MTARKPSTISVEDVGFFEGAEKLLEIWFLLDPQETAQYKRLELGAKRGLRTIPRYSLLYTLETLQVTSLFAVEVNLKTCWSWYIVRLSVTVAMKSWMLTFSG